MYSSQASVAHLPHPVIAYSWDTALNLVAYPMISYEKALSELMRSNLPQVFFLAAL